MSKYKRFQFADNAEIKRRAGSDWLYDKNDRWRTLRSWDSAESKWTPAKVGEDYYGKIGGSEWVVSVPVHYIIAKPNDEVSYRGYFPVSQLRSSLKDKINLAGVGEFRPYEFLHFFLKLERKCCYKNILIIFRLCELSYTDFDITQKAYLLGFLFS